MEKNEKNVSYETDLIAWLYNQANLLRNRDYEKIDTIHLMEEIESLGNSEKSKLESHFMILLLHLLKLAYQPESKTRSWYLSIKNAKYHAKRTLQKSPSLKHYLLDILQDAYFSARLGAAQETGLSEKTFPEECPWTFEEIMEEE